MTTTQQIPPPPESTVRLRTSRLDPKRPSPTVPRMSTDGAPPTPLIPDARAAEQRALLRAQPWGRLLGQMTAIAFKRIRGRSLDDAQDLAQSAIADAHRSLERGGWDPAKGPLESFLVARVISAAGNERRRKRNTCEVWLDEEEEDEDGRGQVSAHEKYLGDDRPAADEALDRLRFAADVPRSPGREARRRRARSPAHWSHAGRDRCAERSPYPPRGARRRRSSQRRERIQYHAKELTKELSASVGSLPAGCALERGDAMSTTRKPVSLWKAIKEAEIQDDVDEVLAMSDAELDAYLAAHGGDPAKIRADGEALAKHLDAERDRLAWQEVALKELNEFRAAAAVRLGGPREKLSRDELFARIERARKDPRFTQPVTVLFRNKTPEAATDEELQAILDEIELLAELENE